MRAGAHALTLLSAPFTVDVLTTLENGPMALIDLRRATGSPPQTTARNKLTTLTKLGILERHQHEGFPGSVDYELGKAGRELLEVARVTAAWLTLADSPTELGTSAAKHSIKALVDGWSSTMVRAVASGPLSLTQLNRLISTVNYPSLERRLAAMRLTGQIVMREKRPCRSRPYSATPWLRRAIGPLAAAAAWEREFGAGASTPMGAIDVESIFLLALPLLRLPSHIGGAARLMVELRGSDGRLARAGVMVRVEEGKIRSCISRAEGDSDAWAYGSVGTWLEAAITGNHDGLEIGGDCELASSLIDGMHGALFGAPQAV
jgi:DNA-binding HxlR family transcriptional regulator